MSRRFHGHRRARGVVAACVAAFAALAGHGLVAQNQTAPRIQPLPYADGEILVRFRSDASLGVSNTAHAAIGAAVQRAFTVVPNLQLVRLPAGMTMDEGLAIYRARADVVYAEPNYLVQALGVPNDPRFGELWGLRNDGNGPSWDPGIPDADIDAPEAWNITQGSDAVVIAVIDTGIDYNHQDLAANMFHNTPECTPNGVDDDHNGYIDDCYGLDTVNHDGDPMDDNNHGTHVAGTIGARGDNGIGVVGVNWKIRMVACKFLGAGGSGSTAGAIECLEYLKRLKDSGVNLVATNNSWGGGGFSQALLDAIDAHRQRGILFVAAAGNAGSNNNVQAFYPANYYLPNVISVAATTRAEAQARFSNYGLRNVHIAAPGQSILSTTRNNTYSSFSGTSMATPHVAGVIGLIKAQNPSRDWGAIKNLLLAGGDLRLGMATVTRRRLNAFGSLTCTNAGVLSRLKPVNALTVGFVGIGVDLAALHINCANPNGNVPVTVSPGNALLVLTDSGSGADQAADDGIYSGQFIPSAAGDYVLTFPGGDTVTVKVLAESYTVQPTGYNYRTITGRSLGLENGSSRRIVSPFPVRLGGAAFDAVIVSDDGVLSFDRPVTGFPSNFPVSGRSIVLAPFWMDLYVLSEGDQKVFWDVVGSAPSRELVIEWRNLTRYSPCGDDTVNTVRFQVVLSESSTNVLFNYADVAFGGLCTAADRGGRAAIGAQSSPVHGTTYSYYNSTAVSDGTALLLTSSPPSGSSPFLSVTPASHDFGYVPVGQSEERTFTAQNLGVGVLTGTVSADAPFSVVSGSSFSLPATSSQAVTVRYSPRAATASFGSATFSSNASTGYPTLSGTGIDTGCTFSISPASQSVASAGGTFSATVAASPATCSWTATSHASWNTITSGAVGTGNGSVGFSVAANTGGSRTATLTIAGKVLTITQASGTSGSGTGPGPRPAPGYAADQILVRFRPDAAPADVTSTHALSGAIVARAYDVVQGLQLVRLPAGLSVSDALAYYAGRPDVLYAEPDYTVRTLVTPDDSRFSELWGLHNVGAGGSESDPPLADADIDAPEAWDLTTGSASVVVAVIDTGIDYNHADLAANMFRNEVECTSNGVDEDKNGYVDDCYGIDAYNDDGDPFDDHSHGTHVAGTIGARGNNGAGVVGVNWAVKMIACKFLGAGGSGSTSGAIECLEYLRHLKDRGVNLVATNNSWGGGSFSRGLLDAIDAHRRRGILFVAAAGNDGVSNNANDTYPANYYLQNVLSVAASTRTDTRARFSNYGRRTVHLAAPGQGILSTTPNNRYSTFSGTSMAAPHVTGVAALLKAQSPSRDWRAIRNLILAGGDSKTMGTITQRRLNARGALACSSSVVLSRLRPAASTIRAFVGEPIELAALHIICGTPNGNVSVTASDGQTVTLRDDGAGRDQEAGDGAYTGLWTPTAMGTATLSFPTGDTVTAEVLGLTYSAQQTAYNYRAIDGSGTSLDVEYWQSVEFAPPFPVQFGGRSFGSFFIDGRGIISFDAPIPLYMSGYHRLPRADVAAVVAPFWDDLFPPPEGIGQNVYWAVVGTAPNRELVIEWRNLTRAFPCGDDAANTVRFQAVFFESSSDVVFSYADTVFGGLCVSSDRGGSANVGIQTGRGHAAQFSFLEKKITDGQSILWTAATPGAIPTLAIDPYDAHYFGVVAVGSFEDRTFRVTNLGGGTLTGTAAMTSGSNSAFTVVSGSSFSVGSGQSHDVVVRYAPGRTGAVVTGYVTFTSNAHPGMFLYVEGDGTVSPTEPLIRLDGPTNGSTIGSSFTVSGWAIDRGALSSTGIDAVHAYAFPNPGSGAPPVALGAATYGLARTDIGSIFGSQFTGSGYSLSVSGIAAGTYQITAFGHSTLTNTFSAVAASVVTVQAAVSRPVLSLDGPQSNSTVGRTVTAAGWAVDLGSSSGTGVDTVHVWAYPNDGSAAQFMGVATYGLARPDIGAALGARFTNSGYRLSAVVSPPGVYRIVAFAHSTVANAFSAAVGASNVTVQDTNSNAVLFVDTPGQNTSPTRPFAVSGWAVDSGSTSGTGIDAIHVWAFPTSGAAATFVGVATYGRSRPDIGSLFGNSRFNNSGFTFTVDSSNLAAGSYDLIVFGRSTVTNGFTVARVVRVNVE